MLTEDMIRVTQDPNGSKGKLIRDRRLVVYINGTITLKDKRGRQRRFAKRGGAYTAARKFIAEYNQTTMGEQPACVEPGAPSARTTRWTRQGQMLSYDGVPALTVAQHRDERGNSKLRPVACDAIADYVCSMLNTIDVDALTRVWMGR